MNSFDVVATACEQAVEAVVAAGVTHAVICPGSRSTPLALAMWRNPQLEVTVVLDERVGGFLALGAAKATGRPAIVLMTSGTAVAEVHAAVAEAHYGAVPLVVWSADRPAELQHVGAPQTINQVGLFGPDITFVHCPAPAPDAVTMDVAAASAYRDLFCQRVVGSVLHAGATRCPVHCNIAFREPLVGTPAALPPLTATEVPAGVTSLAARTSSRATLAQLGEVGATLAAQERVLVLAGERSARDTHDAFTIAEQVTALGWVLLADPLSGLVGMPGVISAGAALTRATIPPQVMPTAMVVVGALPAAKSLQQLVKNHSGPVVLVDPAGLFPDPFRRGDHKICADLSAVLTAVCDVREQNQCEENRPHQPRFLHAWQVAEERVRAAQHDFFATHHPVLSEPLVAQLTAQHGGPLLWVSSSMPIRDVETFGTTSGTTTVFANRGVNGIDGVVSSALGAVWATGEPGVLLIGDLALRHDIGALPHAVQMMSQGQITALHIVVTDNQGGGIFSMLPQHGLLQADEYEALFGTPQTVPLAGLLQGCGWQVSDVVDSEVLVQNLITRVGLSVSHVQTKRHQEQRVREDFWERLGLENLWDDEGATR